MSIKIIAECCQNHNGDPSILKDMIWQASEAGASHVKIQSMLSADLSFRERFEHGLVEGGVVKTIKRPYDPEFNRLKLLDLTDEDHQWFIEECLKAKVIPITTAFSRSRIPFLKSLNWDEIKVASYDCSSPPLINDLKQSFKHLYISTGATFDSEIAETAALLKEHSFTFLHCVTIYPTPLNEMHLARMSWLKQFTPSVGFSDHSLVKQDGIKASLAAIYLGAEVIERHYTILAPDQSRDGPVSINPIQLRELVEFSKWEKTDQKKYIEQNIPEFESMLGQKTRELSQAELLNRDYYRGRFASKKDGKTIYNWEPL